MQRRSARAGLVALGVLLAMGALVSAQPSSAAPPRVVRVAIPGYENNLTPFTLSFGAFPNTHDLINLVYDTLFWSQSKEQPEPWLAETATASADNLTWTVKLRSGVTWHDGVAFTADDVAFTFDYYRSQAGSSGRYAHHVFDVPPLDRAEVVDPLTVRLVYKAPAPTFRIMPGADLPILPKHIWDKVAAPGTATKDLPIGTGPFKVVEMVSDQRYRMVANAAYFKGKPTVDELDLRVVKDQAAAFGALSAGDVDMVARDVPPELSAQYTKGTDVKVLKATRFESDQLYWNARKAPLTDPRLRKAISLAVDSQALVDTVLLGHGTAGRDGFTHPESPWAMPGGTHEHDLAKAQRMLDDAGYTARDADGVRKAPNGQRLEFHVLVSSFEPQDLRAVQLMGQQIAPTGVRVVADALDPAALRTRRQAPPGQAPTYDAYVSTLETHAHVDPDSLYYFFHSPGPKGFGATISGYSNAKFDALSEKAATLAPAERKPLLHDMQRILADEAPAIVFWYRDGEHAFRPAAYAGWVPDPGQGIFTKRSFLPAYAKTAAASTGRTPGKGGGTGLKVGVGVLALVALAAVGLVARRRRRAGVDEDD
ncbi:MAG: ABC transporter substrate-binding protein [Mycobacteriales bacterium]